MDAIDADAETARQLNRALTMSRTGSTAAWEATLRRLGLDVSQQPDRIGLLEQFKQDWSNVIMDSVKRKKKKKMKKHKYVFPLLCCAFTDISTTGVRREEE